MPPPSNHQTKTNGPVTSKWDSFQQERSPKLKRTHEVEDVDGVLDSQVLLKDDVPRTPVRSNNYVQLLERKSWLNLDQGGRTAGERRQQPC